MGVVGSLAWARLRHHPARWLLVSLGVAVATVLPVLAANTVTLVAVEAVRYGVAALPPGDRSVVAYYQGLRETPERIRQLDGEARAGLTQLATGPIRAQVLTRRIADGKGGSYYFGAADDLRTAVRLTSGRLPTQCRPDLCEVVALGAGTPNPDPTLGLVVVGRAERADPLLLTGSFDPGPESVLLADGVAAAAQLEALAAFQRTYSWVTSVDLDRVDQLGVDGYLDRSVRVSIELYRDRLSLAAPDNTLRAEAARAERSARRFALLGGAAMALLLGFAAIGAIGLRRDHTAAVALLRRRGASRGRAGLLTVISAAVPVLGGTVVGLAAGLAVAAWRARSADLPAWASAVDAVAAATPTVLGGALAATAVVVATLTAGLLDDAGAARELRGGDAPATVVSPARLVDFTIVAGVLVAALALARGAVTSASLGDRTDPLLLALPVIVVVCGGLLVGRVWPALAAAGARLTMALTPRRWIAHQLGLLGAVRQPLRPAATAAFLAAATGIVVFAGAYQATLRQGAADQATFTVPLDATVRTGPTLQRPLDVAPLTRFASDTGASVHPVIRAAAGVRVNASRTVTAELVGVDPGALTHIRSWDAVVGGPSAARVGRLLGAGDRPATLPRGFEVPAGARTLEILASGDLADVDLSLWLRTADGRDIGLPLRVDGARLVASVPQESSPARAFAVTVTESSFAATRRLHRTGEGGNDAEALVGRISLGPPMFPDAVSPGWTDWAPADPTTATASVSDGRLDVSYRIAGTKVVLQPGAVVTQPIPVLADAGTAAAAQDGLLQLDVGGMAPLSARVVAVVHRFPTVGGTFVVGDVHTLADALDARDPGTGSVSELWLAAPTGRADQLADALRSAPYDRLRSDLRAADEAQLAADPLAVGASRLLTGSALLALLVAVVALVLLGLAEQRNESAQLYAWESDGVAPSTLRRALFVRTVAVVAVGVPGGVLMGLVLSMLTTALVTVTAVGTSPVPPLVLAIGPVWTAAVVLLGVGIGLVVCAIVAATAAREPLPRRPEEGLW